MLGNSSPLAIQSCLTALHSAVLGIFTSLSLSHTHSLSLSLSPSPSLCSSMHQSIDKKFSDLTVQSSLKRGNNIMSWAVVTLHKNRNGKGVEADEYDLSIILQNTLEHGKGWMSWEEKEVIFHSYFCQKRMAVLWWERADLHVYKLHWIFQEPRKRGNTAWCGGGTMSNVIAQEKQKAMGLQRKGRVARWVGG